MVNVATAAPTWLASIEAELDWRRVQAVTRRGDVQRGPLRASLRRRGRLAEASRALALARDREAGGRTAAARSLTEIIVAEIPAFKPGWTFREERLARAPAPGAESGKFSLRGRLSAEVVELDLLIWGSPLAVKPPAPAPKRLVG
jgi:hypothetical protein